MALSNKDKLFCIEYLKDFNATRAYKAVYVKCSDETARRNGSKKLTKTDIQNFIQQSSNERLKKVEVDVDYIIKNIKEVTERCMQKEPVEYFDKVDKEWKPVTEYAILPNNEEIEARVMKFDATNALKGLELLGKYKNIFSENVKLSGNIDLQKDMNAISSVASQMEEVNEEQLSA